MPSIAPSLKVGLSSFRGKHRQCRFKVRTGLGQDEIRRVRCSVLTSQLLILALNMILLCAKDSGIDLALGHNFGFLRSLKWPGIAEISPLRGNILWRGQTIWV
jgi:hypothetical protein